MKILSERHSSKSKPSKNRLKCWHRNCHILKLRHKNSCLRKMTWSMTSRVDRVTWGWDWERKKEDWVNKGTGLPRGWRRWQINTTNWRGSTQTLMPERHRSTENYQSRRESVKSCNSQRKDWFSKYQPWTDNWVRRKIEESNWKRPYLPIRSWRRKRRNSVRKLDN